MPSPRERAYDFAVIGGGTAGMTVATQVAMAGKRVALIEAERTGGDCLYTGCVPSKSLIASARALQTIREAGVHGISVSEIRLDLGQTIDRKQRIIEVIEPHDSPERLARAGVEVIAGHARFTSPRTLAVGDEQLRAGNFAITTGSQPAVPCIPGLAESGYVTNVEMLDRREVPRRLAVIGAGSIGLELGQTFARFGSEVTVIGRGPRMLRRDEPASTDVLQRALEREGIAFHMQTMVERVEATGTGKRLRLRNAVGEETGIETDEILVAVGRKPRTENLGLDLAGVDPGEAGIQVDKRLRTSASHIWACGDVTGPPYWTHAAEDQARTVAANVLGGRKTWSARAIPWATYTDPEVAGVGLTIEEARQRHGDRIDVLQWPYGAIDRAQTDGATAGLMTVILTRGWTRGRLGGEIAGAHIVGQRAGDLINQFAFMMAWRLPAGMLARTVQTYPSLSLGVRQVVARHWTK